MSGRGVPCYCSFSGFTLYSSYTVQFTVSFINQLRARLESLNLITEKTNNCYEDNLFWKKKFEFIIPRILNNVNICLKKFSQNYDELLLTAKTKIDVAINTNPDNKLFFYYIDYDEFKSIQKNASEQQEFSIFFEYLENIMWEKTDECLAKVQNWIYEELRNNIYNCFDNLLGELEHAKSGTQMIELDNSIHSAKNGINDDLSIVLAWFKRNKYSIKNTIQLNHAIETSVECFKSTYKPKNIFTQIKNKDDKETHVQLNYDSYKHLSLAVITALNNALQHGQNDHENLIEISYSSDEIQSKIKIKNRSIKDYTENELYKLKELFKTPNIKLATQEGGTGLYKINTLIKQSFKKATLDIKKDGNYFICEIIFQP